MVKLICTDCNGVLEHIDHDYSISGYYKGNTEIIDKIYNSADLMCLKEDNDFELYKKISVEYGLNKNEILVIDDNVYIIEKLSEYGFETYLYNKETYNKFEIWFEKNCK